MGHRHAEGGGDTAHHHDPDRVALRIADGGIAGPHHPEQRVHERPATQRVEQGDEDGAVKAEGADTPGGLLLLAAQQPGDQAAAAHAEQVGQRRHDEDQHVGQRRRGDLVGVVGFADEVGIGQIVDHRDELADDGGHRQRGQRPGHRHGLKQFLIFSHPVLHLPPVSRRLCCPGQCPADGGTPPALRRSSPAAGWSRCGRHSHSGNPPGPVPGR